MSQIIDRRLNGKNKSAVNRQRFINRFKKQIKDAVSNSISNKKITDITKNEKIFIPTSDTSEPVFQHGVGGNKNIILPGNEEFVVDDKIKKPPSNQASNSKGNDASNSGEGEDNFSFHITREEFLNIFFEDLELPNLIKKELVNLETYKFSRGGYTSEGIPTNINVVKSLTVSLSRKRAITGQVNEKIDALKKQLEIEEDKEKKRTILLDIETLENKKKKIPFIDSYDLRYNNKIKTPDFSTSACMFCLMDVSGSMDENKKDIAKRFFILLYLFLKKNYNKIDIIFIRHHTSAKEVNEQDFFHSRETGGTVVSSALELLHKTIEEKYNHKKWNIYVAQASDGDNWNNDSPRCKELLMSKIMPLVQYYSYIEIMPRHHQSLWEAYQEINKKYSHFSMESIKEYNEIYPVFRELFKKNKQTQAAHV